MLHESGAAVEHGASTSMPKAKRYEEPCCSGKGPIDVPGLRGRWPTKAARLKAPRRTPTEPPCASATTTSSSMNFLIDEDDKYVPHRLGVRRHEPTTPATSAPIVVCCESQRRRGQAGRSSDYFGRTPTPEELRHNLAYVQLAGWCWYVWALLKEAEGDFVGEWLYIYFHYAERAILTRCFVDDDSFYRGGIRRGHDATAWSSGILWGLDTVVLGIALCMVALRWARPRRSRSRRLRARRSTTCSAPCGCFAYMGNTRAPQGHAGARSETRSGKCGHRSARCSGGPIGMTGYVMAINNIGAGYTAIISAFYPALGAFHLVHALLQGAHERKGQLGGTCCGACSASWRWGTSPRARLRGRR